MRSTKIYDRLFWKYFSFTQVHISLSRIEHMFSLINTLSARDILPFCFFIFFLICRQALRRQLKTHERQDAPILLIC